MKRDMDDRQRIIDEARLLFAEYSEFLYGKPAGLSVNVNSSGYTFTFTIDREGSGGVEQMVVFCFDLTVATLRARRKAGFQALIHDSTLFADVDATTNTGWRCNSPTRVLRLRASNISAV